MAVNSTYPWLKLVAVMALTGSSALTTQKLAAQDITALGGDLTSSLPAKVTVQLPSPNISSEELFQFHLTGFVEFHRDFSGVKLNDKRVLGPKFNHDSCGGCHTQNGKGKVLFSSTRRGSPMLLKISRRGLNSDGSPRSIPRIGEQLRDHLRGGKTAFDISLSYKYFSGTFPDGEKYKLRKPIVEFDIPEMSEEEEDKLVTSLRMSPPMVGFGLLEAVPDSQIESLADPDDLDGDGISGRVSYVPNLETNAFSIGRFGFRASHPTVKQQTAAAFFNDMGMTSELFSSPTEQQEVSADELHRIVFYLQAAGVPPARDQSDPDVIAGKALFQQIGCDDCHSITLTTDANAPIEETKNQTFHPFTDLLLHDMGPGLADKRPEFSATGREWRTTPLWGIGLTGVFNNNAPGYLHDGRARTLQEAILWHGGEAASSRDAYKNLDSTDRFRLVRFLKSL